MMESMFTQKKNIARLLRFFHPEKRFGFLPGSHNEQALSTFFGLSIEDYSSLITEYKRNVEDASFALLDEEDYLHAIQSLDRHMFKSISVIGDSLTDDYQSWFEIFKHSFQQVHGVTDTTFINTANSGDTSAALLGTIARLEDVKPDLLFCFIGTNDARIQAGSKSCVSIEETIKNLDTIADVGKSIAKRFIWICPPGVMPSRIKNDWLLKSFKASWSEDQIKEISYHIINRLEPSIDLTPLFDVENRAQLFLEDGLHWSLEGQKVTARHVVHRLADSLLS